MARSVFFSWQADTPNRVGRTFLRAALEEVCRGIAAEATLDEASRDVAVDSDTQGVAGQPPIAETIFKKIDSSAVFVADMTFTGTRLDGRPTPNPNVLIEYGWALKALGHERVICVMNSAYGKPSRENLPFDLAYLRWPIAYALPDGSSSETKAEEHRKLCRVLKDAVLASLATLPKPMTEAPPGFPEAEAKDGPARFRAHGEALGFEDDSFGGSRREVFLSAGPAMWLRLMPSTNPAKLWTPREMREIATRGEVRLLPLVRPSGSYSYLRASDGIGMYGVGPPEQAGGTRPDAVLIKSVTFVFRTAEVWSIDTALLSYQTDRLFETDIEKAFAVSAESYRKFLKDLGVDPPYRWRAGLMGAKGRHLGYPPPPGQVLLGAGPVCAADLIEAEGVLGSDQPARSALLPFFEKLFEECALERPDYLPR